MRVQIKDGHRQINLVLPTNLVFSRLSVWLAVRLGRKYAGDAMKNIPPEAIDALFRELRRVKKKYGKWDIMEVSSKKGQQILFRI